MSHFIKMGIALLLGSALACGRAPSPGFAEDAHAAAEPAGCEATWSRTAEWAAALSREPSHDLGTSKYPLVSVDVELDADADKRGMDVVVTPTELIDNHGPVTLAALDEALADMAARRERFRQHGLRLSNVVLVATQTDVAWSRVVEVIEHVRRAGLEITFLFGRARAVEKPGWSWRDVTIRLAAEAFYSHADTDEVPPPGPDMRPPALAQRETLLGIFAGCPELARRVREGSHEALVASLADFRDPCRCDVDQRSLRAALWAIHPADGSTGRTLRLAAPDDATATLIEASPGAPWSEVGPRLASLPRGTAIRLRVAR